MLAVAVVKLLSELLSPAPTPPECASFLPPWPKPFMQVTTVALTNNSLIGTLPVSWGRLNSTASSLAGMHAMLQSSCISCVLKATSCVSHTFKSFCHPVAAPVGSAQASYAAESLFRLSELNLKPNCDIATYIICTALAMPPCVTMYNEWNAADAKRQGFAV